MGLLELLLIVDGEEIGALPLNEELVRNADYVKKEIMKVAKKEKGKKEEQV